MKANVFWRRIIFVMFSLLLIHSLPSLAQTFRGGITGTIVDNSGAAIPEAIEWMRFRVSKKANWCGPANTLWQPRHTESDDVPYQSRSKLKP